MSDQSAKTASAADDGDEADEGWLGPGVAGIWTASLLADAGHAYAGFAFGRTSTVLLAVPFVLAGIGIGCVETSEHAAVAAYAPADLRGSAFGLLAFIQAAGNLAASAVAGLLWTAVSPTAAFAYLVTWMLIALGWLARAQRRQSAR